MKHPSKIIELSGIKTTESVIWYAQNSVGFLDKYLGGGLKKENICLAINSKR